MSTEVENRIAANAFTGVFLLLSGAAVIFAYQNLIVSLIIVLIGIFFVMRSLAQWRATAD